MASLIKAELEACFARYTDQLIELQPSFCTLFAEKRLSKSATYLAFGRTWDQFAVITEGFFRLYYLDAYGKQHTKGIFGAGSVLAPCAPVAICQPVNFVIEAFTPAQLLCADYRKVRNMLQACSWGQSLLIGMLEQVLNEKVEREFALLTLDAQSRYERFCERNPDLAQVLPLHLVANYLGMTDVTLSRVRKKMGHAS